MIFYRCLNPPFTSAGLMLGQRRRRWLIIDTALFRTSALVFILLAVLYRRDYFFLFSTSNYTNMLFFPVKV